MAFLDLKAAKHFERVARKNPIQAKNALLLAMGTSEEEIFPIPKPRLQRLAKYIVNLRDGFKVAHDENYLYAEMYIQTFLK